MTRGCDISREEPLIESILIPILTAILAFMYILHANGPLKPLTSWLNRWSSRMHAHEIFEGSSSEYAYRTSLTVRKPVRVIHTKHYSAFYHLQILFTPSDSPISPLCVVSTRGIRLPSTLTRCLELLLILRSTNPLLNCLP